MGQPIRSRHAGTSRERPRPLVRAVQLVTHRGPGRRTTCREYRASRRPLRRRRPAEPRPPRRSRLTASWPAVPRRSRRSRRPRSSRRSRVSWASRDPPPLPWPRAPRGQAPAPLARDPGHRRRRGDLPDRRVQRGQPGARRTDQEAHRRRTVRRGRPGRREPLAALDRRPDLPGAAVLHNGPAQPGNGAASRNRARRQLRGGPRRAGGRDRPSLRLPGGAAGQLRGSAGRRGLHGGGAGVPQPGARRVTSSATIRPAGARSAACARWRCRGPARRPSAIRPGRRRRRSRTGPTWCSRWRATRTAGRPPRPASGGRPCSIRRPSSRPRSACR